jgi:hypothetical protein
VTSPGSWAGRGLELRWIVSCSNFERITDWLLGLERSYLRSASGRWGEVLMRPLLPEAGGTIVAERWGPSAIERKLVVSSTCLNVSVHNRCVVVAASRASNANDAPFRWRSNPHSGCLPINRADGSPRFDVRRLPGIDVLR